MCNKKVEQHQKIAVHLKTKEQADTFFKETGFPIPSCGCTRSNWDYKHNTAYHIGREEFGNVRMYQPRANATDTYKDTIILSFEQFMYLRGLTLAKEYEIPELLETIEVQLLSPEEVIQEQWN